jgi:hypothetical protein
MNGPRTEDAPGPVGGAGSPGGPGTDESY